MEKLELFIEKYFNPDYFFQNPILWAGLFVAVFVSAFMLHQLYIRQNVVNSIVESRKKALREAKTKDQQFEDEFGALKHKTLVYKLDRLILVSGIKSKLKFINAETYLIFATILSVGAGILGTLFIDVFFGLFLMACVIVTLHIFISSQANRTYTKIEDQTSIFVSILCNHSKGSNDIVLIMKRILPELSNPMYTLVRDFITNADTYGSTDVAFDIMKESIDNRQLQVIITNLKTCSHYEANYEVVLQQMLGQITAELSFREERRLVLFNGKVTVAALTVVASVILLLIAKMLEIPIYNIMFQTMFGEVLSLMMGIIYLYVLSQLFAADRE